ncbi:trypsin-like peptidase domain-containing protein, partial [Candidatus Berkelbacteria bacterium]|nr:trypsin-like peptidase domain-containing protein [Candidatus Berkelbacteria bacterium]
MNRKVIIWLTVLSLGIGMVGGIGGATLLAGSPFLKKLVGITELPIGSETPTRTERIVVQESSAVIDVAKKVAPSVVSISTSKDIQDFFGQVFTSQGGGTGFIITSDGLIVTNKHVVDDLSANYTVFTSDGKNFKPKILATDPLLDLAILKIDASGLPVVELGDSDRLQVGEWVVAIGNALAEFQNSVTVGVISAKERQIEAA